LHPMPGRALGVPPRSVKPASWCAAASPPVRVNLRPLPHEIPLTHPVAPFPRSGERRAPSG
ncbi:MAG: hypothetical protein ACREQ5_27795, partial [Candidatus Dormibacteria bacterium]